MSALAHAGRILVPILLGSSLAVAVPATNGIKVVENRASDWRIVAPPPGSPGASWAALQLQKYVRQMTGCKLPIIPRTRGKPAFVIGFRNEIPPDDRGLLPPLAAGFDAYAAAIAPATRKTQARIVISAQTGRGLVYGVYDVLERFGCRWAASTNELASEAIPAQTNLSLPAGAWSVGLPTEYRLCTNYEWAFDIKPESALNQLDSAMKHRYNAVNWTADSHTPLDQQYRKLADDGLLGELARREMFLRGSIHLNLLLRSEDYFKNHPDWFGPRGRKRVPQGIAGAQFCWSNPEARRQFLANAEAFVEQAPQIHILCLEPLAGIAPCECEQCRKAGAERLLNQLMSEVRERVRAVRPEVRVEAVHGARGSSQQ